MAWSTIRRLPFTTYTPSAKRRRTTGRSTTRTLSVRRYQAPEVKQFISSTSLTSVTNGAYASLSVIMTNGDDGNDFVGSKFRILRVRIYYDYTDVTAGNPIRMALGVPKDPTTTSLLTTTALQGLVLPANYHNITILKEKFLKTDGSDRSGVMEWTGPLNVEMDTQGIAALRNNLIFQVNSENQGAIAGNNTRTRIEVIFTG